MKLFYGQIRPANYEALLAHYGHEPPWPMDRCPHISLVQAVIDATPVVDTAYFTYLRRCHGEDARSMLERQDMLVRMFLDCGGLSVQVEHESVLDGNHRAAVALVTGRPPTIASSQPYQTLVYPIGQDLEPFDLGWLRGHARKFIHVDGRRLEGRDIPYDVDGKCVLDLGCAQGMMSITALLQGASHVVAVDADLRSTTWRVRDAWGFTDRMSIIPARVEDLDEIEVDVVLAYSIERHVDPQAFARVLRGRVCVLETHAEGEPPPSTGHVWTFVQKTPYSRADPQRRRDVYVGMPL